MVKFTLVNLKKFYVPILFLALIIVGYWFYSQAQSKQKEQGSLSQQNETKQTSPVTEVSKVCSGKAIVPLAEGPYYKAGSPETQTVRTASTPGTPLTLEGYVFDTDCKPIPNALLDFWQTDEGGAYDNFGYNLRGHQFTDENGKYKVETVLPGQYPGRTEHIHFKIRASDAAPTITSQLFFPNSTGNSNDSIFNESLVVYLSPDQSKATYNFVITK